MAASGELLLRAPQLQTLRDESLLRGWAANPITESGEARRGGSEGGGAPPWGGGGQERKELFHTAGEFEKTLTQPHQPNSNNQVEAFTKTKCTATIHPKSHKKLHVLIFRNNTTY